MTNHYYDAPPQDAFEDMKAAAMVVWSHYDEPYRSEKMNAIKDIQNVEDNFMYILAMFDMHNQRAVGELINEDTKREARERLIAGGAVSFLMPF